MNVNTFGILLRYDRVGGTAAAARQGIMRNRGIDMICVVDFDYCEVQWRRCRIEDNGIGSR